MMKNLIRNFKNPSNRYGPAPFWFLNGDLTTEELEWQVNQMKEKGLFGYVMHSRYGRRIEYFSEEFFDRIGTVVKKSEELGMNAIVYDEDDWPSGMSGTKVIDDHPEYKHKQLEMVYIDCETKSSVEYKADKGNIYAAFACKFKKKSKKREECIIDTYIDISNQAKDDFLQFNNVEGYQTLVVFIFQEVSGYTIYTTFPVKKGFCAQPDHWSWYFPFGEYVDLLNPEAVDYFIETTCEEYKKRFGEHFGKAINYFFTDEPGFYTIMRGDDSAIPWSDIFEKTFNESHDYDIKENLLPLAFAAGNKTKRVRFDFWNHLAGLFERNFVKKYNDWCVKNGVMLTGHFRLCYPQLVWQRNYAGNAMNIFRQMSAPGVDRLDTPGMNETFATKDWSWQVEDKICSSIANQYGIERRMTESFALGGWEYRYADMKRVTDWQYMMGMNLLVPHAFHYSISGQRKKECPPSFFYQNPMWEKYGEFSKYVCRLGEMMIGGTRVADIAVLYPMTTIWTDDIPQAEVQDVINNIDRDFAYVTDTLLRNHLDYDVLGEEEFEKAEISGGGIKFGNTDYRLLIVPPCITICAQTAEKLSEFERSGGRILFLSRPPQKDVDDRALPFIQSIFEDPDLLSSLYRTYDKNEKISAKTYKLSETISCLDGGVLKDNEPTRELVSAIEILIDRDFKVEFIDGAKANVYYTHTQKAGSNIYFLHNSDEDTAHDLRLTIGSQQKNSYVFYPETGDIKKIVQESKTNGRAVFHFTLKRLQSVFIVFTDETIEGAGEYFFEEKQTVGTVAFKKEWNKKLITPNALVLDTWKMIQNEPLEDNTLASWDSGFGTVLKFTSEFILDDKIDHLKLVLDRIPDIVYEGVKQPVRISVNGSEIKELMPSDFLDHDMYMAEISSFCALGKNTLSIEYNYSMYAFEGKTGIDQVSMMWDSAYVVGDFQLEERAEAENRYVIVRNSKTITEGSWSEQGYPYFNGCMQYEQDIVMEPKEGAKYILDLKDVRECADVYVNGLFAGSRIWMPYTIDISNLVRKGENNIQIQIRNTPKNIMQKCNWPCGMIQNAVIEIKK